MAPISLPRAAVLALAAAPAAVSAFSAPMPAGALARASVLCSGSIAPARRSTLALRMSSTEPRTNTPEEDAAYPLPDNVSREDFLTLRKEGMAPTDAVDCLGKGMTVRQSLLELEKAFARQVATGDAQGFFKTYVDVQGEYTDEGWVDDTPSSGGGGGFGAFFSGLFGGGGAAPIEAAAAIEAPSQPQTPAPAPAPAAAADPSVEAPSQLQTPVPAPAAPDASWVVIMDEASGFNYYHNPATGVTTWDKPLELA